MGKTDKTLETEQALLCLMILYGVIPETVTPAIFSDKRLRVILSAYLWLCANGFDRVTEDVLVHYLQDENRMDEAGGLSYIADVLGAAPPGANIDYYLNATLENARRRAVKQSLKAALERVNAADKPLDVDEIIAGMRRELGSTIPAHTGKPFFKSLADCEVKPPQYIVDGILEQDSLALDYGGSGSFKTFAAISLAASVATGVPFYGHTVSQPGIVLDLAMEGENGRAERSAAVTQALRTLQKAFP
jgi:hypothetical protein